MSDGPSLLSLSAAGLYGLVVIASVMALASVKGAQEPNWHQRSWALLIVLFALLLAMRVTGLEDTLRASARAVLRAEGAFDGRRDFQRILVASLVMIGGGLGLWLVYKAARGSRRKIDVVVNAALGAGLVMGGLIALRFVSLHAVDRLLYGALKLNWVTDVGASCTILVAALYYIRLTRSSGNASRR